MGSIIGFRAEKRHDWNYFFFFLVVCFNCLLTDQITKIILVDTLVHPSKKPVDLVFPIASISTFYKMGGLFLHSTLWRRQFKGPQEVVCFFEMFSNGIDLMNQILHADDSVFPKRLSNQCIVCQGNSLFVDFAITTLVDQFIYRLQIWVPPAQHSENEDHGFWSHHFMGNRWGNSGSSVRLYFWGAPKSLQMVIAAMKLKDAYSLEGKL